MVVAGCPVQQRRAKVVHAVPDGCDVVGLGAGAAVAHGPQPDLDGGPRSKAHDIASVWNRMNNLRPTLLDWSARYDHLREITRDDVLAVLDELHGSRRSNVLGSLRRDPCSSSRTAR